jgi:hypothetical protein
LVAAVSVFSWIKTQAVLAKVKLRGRAKVEAVFTFAVAAYNLIRIPKLLPAATLRPGAGGSPEPF